MLEIHLRQFHCVITKKKTNIHLLWRRFIAYLQQNTTKTERRKRLFFGCWMRLFWHLETKTLIELKYKLCEKCWIDPSKCLICEFLRKPNWKHTQSFLSENVSTTHKLVVWNGRKVHRKMFFPWLGQLLTLKIWGFDFKKRIACKEKKKEKTKKKENCNKSMIGSILVDGN